MNTHVWRLETRLEIGLSERPIQKVRSVNYDETTSGEADLPESLLILGTPHIATYCSPTCTHTRTSQTTSYGNCIFAYKARTMWADMILVLRSQLNSGIINLASELDGDEGVEDRIINNFTPAENEDAASEPRMTVITSGGGNQ